MQPLKKTVCGPQRYSNLNETSVMKNRTYQQIIVFAIITLSISLLFSCNKHKVVQKEDIVVTHSFPACNWTFEEQVLDLDFDIVDTARPYRVEFYLNYDTTLNELTEVPVNITITAPDGMETFVSSVLNFDSKINKDITLTGEGSVANMKLIAFPSKKFNQLGKYTVTFYRKTPKYDNYGMNSLTMKVVPLKK